MSYADTEALDLDKILQTGAEWHVDCGDMVKIENGCRIPILRTFGRILWHAIPEPPATLQGAAIWQIQCHDPRATYYIAGCCHLVNLLSWCQSHMLHCKVQSPSEISVMIVPHAGCKNSICHIENIYIYIYIYWKWFFAKFYLFGCFFKMQFGLWRAPAFVSSPIHLLLSLYKRSWCACIQ